MLPLARSTRSLGLFRPVLSQVVRTHMNHGGGGDSMKLPLDPPGPRTGGIEIGLDSATSVHNILRLLESSHGRYSHAHSTNWHAHGQIWQHDKDTHQWMVQEQAPETPFHKPARLLNLSFSDPRTALAKVAGCDGRVRYLSMLQLEDCKPLNDGWILLREVIGSGGVDEENNNNVNHYHTKSFVSLKQALESYFSIEHGGGLEDKEAAEKLFHPDSALLAVGSDSQSSSDWSAPVGSFLQVSMATYLNGVLFQTPHEFEASQNDAIVAMDILPCGTAAAATVRVGNGAQTRVFEDHLLLGRCESPLATNLDEYSWQILSKTFSPQAWPGSSSEHEHDHSHDHVHSG